MGLLLSLLAALIAVFGLIFACLAAKPVKAVLAAHLEALKR